MTINPPNDFEHVSFRPRMNIAHGCWNGPQSSQERKEMMIRYEFGDAPESEKSEVRKAFERISELAPVEQNVTVRYPVDLPKLYSVTSNNNKLNGFVEGQTDLIINEIRISPLLFGPEELEPVDPRIVVMPITKRVTPVQFTAAHEWGHIVTYPQYDNLMKELSKQPFLTIYLAGFSDLSSYGKSSFQEGLAEAFAEWYLSEGKTKNDATRKLAKIAGWRREF